MYRSKFWELNIEKIYVTKQWKNQDTLKRGISDLKFFANT